MMKKISYSVSVILFAAVLCVSVASSAMACTGFFSKTQDGSVVYARTMEFGMDLQSEVVAVAKGHKYTGTTPDGKGGAEWGAKYNFIGMNFFGTDMVADGMNDAGLQGGLFYFAHQAKYADQSPENAGKAIAPEEFVTWALSTCKDVAELEAHYKDVVLVNTVNKFMKNIPPLHYLFVDKNGDSLVLEFLADGIKVQRNPAGVFTNNPEFSWHLTNLRNYIGLSNENHGAVKVNDYELAPFGQGTGMVGLPGDSTSSSRFVRAFFTLAGVKPFATADEGLDKLMRIIKDFYITKGSVVENDSGKKTDEFTEYEVFKDLNSFVMYLDTYDNLNIRKIDGRKIDFSKAEVQVIKLQKYGKVADITGDISALK